MSKVKAVATGLALATITGLFFWLWRRLKDNVINTQGNRERGLMPMRLR